MFCPNAADWGNIADWVSGIGSMFAVIVALWLGYSEHFNRKQEKRDTLVREAEVENSFLVEAIRLHGRIAAAAQSMKEDFNAPDGPTLEYLIPELRTASETALRYQQMPMINMRSFRLMNDIIRLGSYADNFDKIEWEDVEQTVGSIAFQSIRSVKVLSEKLKASPHYDPLSVY